MELWNEYEGRTIDGVYPLTKLLEPEGRSAFFSTSNGTGVPTVIRLIESHFDDEEILARWRRVAALNNEHLVTLKKFGQVELDGTSLVYAVMEPAEANLGEIVRERRLTVIETKQLAASLVAALEALHTNGLVHEHIEPGNVLAVGESIKLRSDCVREVPEGEEGRALKRRDVRDLALVLLRALTQQRSLEGAARELPLPEPFDQIVKKGISGEWGLREIAALVPPIPVVAPVVKADPVVNVKKIVNAVSASPAASASAARVGAPIVREPVVKQTVVPERQVSSAVPAQSRDRVGFTVEEESQGITPRKIAYAVGALLIVLLAWFFFHGRSSGSNSSAQKSSAPAPIVQGDASAGPSVETTAPAAGRAPTDVPASRNQETSDGRAQWRVVAYTYNHEAQAKQKAAEIAGKHPELRPEVFTPNGRAPYLVAVGGTMSRDEAFAFARKARGEGLPRDIYAQNYVRKGR
jgi:hypothetical protein